MEHFHLIVNGYIRHNIAMIGATKEQLYHVVMIHLNSLPKVRKEQIGT